MKSARKGRTKKRKVKDEERRRIRDEKMGPLLRGLVNGAIYLGLAAILGFIIYRGYIFYVQFQEDIARQNGPIDATIPDDYRQSD